MVREPLEPGGEVGVAPAVDEHHPAPFADRGRNEPAAGERQGVELVFLRNMAQRSVEGEVPRVIRAHDARAGVPPIRQQFDPAVRAEVVERAQLAVEAPHHEHGVESGVDRDEVAGRGQLVGRRREVPRRCEQLLLLARVPLVAEIRLGREQESGVDESTVEGGGFTATAVRLRRCVGSPTET